MAGLGMYLTVCLVVILVVTSTAQLTVNAQTITKPSVPAFSLEYVDHSYDVPLTYTYSTDPYTGEQIATPHGGNHVENKTVDVVIRNQPFTSYRDAYGNYTSIWYNIRFKGHFANDSDWNYYASYPNIGYVKSTSKDVTIVSITRGGFDFKPRGQVDVQVQALIGSESTIEILNYDMTLHYFLNGTESDWSNTQTITIPDSSSSVTPAPSSTNSQSSTTPTMPPDTNSDNSTVILFSIIVATLVISIILLLLYVRHLKKNNAVKN